MAQQIQAQPNNTFGQLVKRLNTRLALILTFLLIVLAGRFSLTFFLEEHSAEVVNTTNVSGRQRMLSQRISKAALLLETNLSPAERRQRLAELETAIADWTSAHVRLRQQALEETEEGYGIFDPLFNTGYYELLPPLYNEIDAPYQAMVNAAECILVLNDVLPARANCGQSTAPHIETIIANEPLFLAGMEQIVSTYELDAAAHAQRSSQINLVTFGLLALLLGGGIAGVFLPALGQMRLVFNEQQTAQKALEEAQEELLGFSTWQARNIETLQETKNQLKAQEERLRALHTLETQAGLNEEELFRSGLRRANELLGTQIGIISHIKGDDYIVKHHDAPEDAGLSKEQVFEVGVTYCAMTLAQKDVLAIDHMGASEYKGHPSYTTFELETYIGAPLIVNGVSYGTVNFSSSLPRTAPFSAADQDFVRLFTQWVAHVMEQRAAREQIQNQNKSLVKANYDLAVSQKKLAEVSRLKDEFLANMSHELRTPLNAVIGYTQIILAGISGEINQAQRDNLDRVLSNARSLLDLINEILDIAKIEAGRIELVNEAFDLRAWLADIVRQTEGLAEGRPVAYRISIAEDVPQTVHTDAARLRQVLVNLVANAFKFTEEGHVAIRVTREADMLAISVEDSGIGIPAHAQQYVFDEFRQVDGSSQRKHGGTGLGLAIVRRLVKMMDGSISLQSEPGVGTTFTVRLPLQPEADAAPVPAQALNGGG